MDALYIKHGVGHSWFKEELQRYLLEKKKIS